jgi:hypothetical protein
VSGERSEIALVVQRARITHAKSVATLPDGEVDDLDHLGRTLDQAIADAVLATITTLTADLAAERAEVERLTEQNATLRRNEWRLIWGLCIECGANRDKEARRER